jgi:preprotein translocase SecE subunit
VSKVVSFFYEVLFELKKIKWPTQRELLIYGWTVFWVVVVSALMLGAMDLFFGHLIQVFIGW